MDKVLPASLERCCMQLGCRMPATHVRLTGAKRAQRMYLCSAHAAGRADVKRLEAAQAPTTRMGPDAG